MTTERDSMLATAAAAAAYIIATDSAAVTLKY